MRRRWTAFFLAVCLLLAAGCGAANGQPEYEDPISLYYLYRDENTGVYAGPLGAMATEQIERTDLQSLLKRYLQGPQSPELASPFPQDMTLQDARVEHGVLTLEIAGLESLTGLSRTLALACLVCTATQLQEVEAVAIAGIADIPLTRDDFLLYDDAATSDQVTVKLYFSDPSARFLVEETRSRTFSSTMEQLEYVVEQLLQGPTINGTLPALPEGTELISLGLSDGLCTVDLSRAFYENRPKTHGEARMAVFSLVDALTELEEVEQVRLTCEGETMADYCGLDLTAPLTREPWAVGLEREERWVMEATLYVPCGEKLAPVAVCLRRTAGRTAMADVLSALLSFESSGGYDNPFPEGTLVASVEVRSGLCTVVFNSAFALCDSDPAQATQAVRAVVTTLCALQSVEQVQLQVYGAQFTAVDLSEPLTVGEDWILP